MPGPAIDEIELIIEDIRGGGGKPPSRGDDDDGGDEGGGGDRAPEPRRPNSKKYSTAVLIAIASIVMLFLVLTAAFVALRVENLHTWAGIRMPGILWINTSVLLLSSGTLELARRKLRMQDAAGFRRMWGLTTGLGLLFVGGQAIAWRQLAVQGVYVTSGLASSFFYVFTALHAVHLLGGICALSYVGLRKFDSSDLSRSLAAEVASYYWHFMDGLWLFLLALLYLGS
ncbi:MAG TPA: cytochrome c oxidase subunit 3 [Candidatus Eisenbacteria bacterium]|jgi:cytochrome c oxidase subunit 3|nr:cytochrome c oxidase subunit 3 [Candidatus Eisenbacteria bacterium]